MTRVEELLLRLAGAERVKGHTRNVKGKQVRVGAYTRSPGDMADDEIVLELKELAESPADDPVEAVRQRTRATMLRRELAKRARVAGPADKLLSEVGETRREMQDPRARARLKELRKELATRAGEKEKPVGKIGENAPREAEAAVKKEAAKEKRPSLDDAQYETHVKRIQGILANPETVKQDTTLRHGARDAEGKLVENMYSAERAAEHRKIIAEILAKHTNVPRDRKAVMSGGLGGAGKGYVLENYADIDEHDFVTVDPDKMKEELIRRGLAPEVEGLAPMETAALIHEESSALAKLLTKAALARGMNVIIDGTMAKSGSTIKKAEELKAAGYDVEAVFVDVSVDTSKQSALDRHRGGVERLLDGSSPLGGRYVPLEYLEASRTPPGSEYLSKNAEVFAELQKRGVFSRARVFDNSDRSPGAVPKLMSDVRAEGAEARDPAAQLSKGQRGVYETLIRAGMSPKKALATAKRYPAGDN